MALKVLILIALSMLETIPAHNQQHSFKPSINVFEELKCDFRYQSPRPIQLDSIVDRKWYFHACTEESFILRLQRLYAANQSFVEFFITPDIEGLINVRAQWYQPKLEFLRVLPRVWTSAAGGNQSGSSGDGEYRRTIGDHFVIRIRVFNDILPEMPSDWRVAPSIEYLAVTECLTDNSRLTLWLLASKPVSNQQELQLSHQLVQRFRLIHSPEYPEPFYPSIIYPSF